ncbi:MAG: SDR family NAD(P)-dependent oxidoreductase [Pseudomonadota bacterium]
MNRQFQARRSFLKQCAAISVLSSLPASLLGQIITRDPIPSGFGARSTAEQVTEGLNLSGRTYAVTGCNSGLGLETMRVLALRGAHVIGIARTQTKAEAACASVAGETTPVFLDLAEWDTVVRCAEMIRSMNLPLDGLITNAGIMALPELQLVNGVEKQFAVNHLGHFILINQLREQVLAAPQGRFVILSSGLHERASNGIEFDNLDGRRHYHPWDAYGVSKLANALCARSLATQLSGSNATANCLHPGVIKTNLVRHLPGWQQWGMKVFGGLFLKNVEQGAATSCYVASNPALAGVRGFYFADCNVSNDRSEYVYDDDMAKQLWKVSGELTREYLPT